MKFPKDQHHAAALLLYDFGQRAEAECDPVKFFTVQKIYQAMFLEQIKTDFKEYLHRRFGQCTNPLKPR